MTSLVAAFYTAEDGKYTWLVLKQEDVNIGGPRRMIVLMRTDAMKRVVRVQSECHRYL